MTLNLSQRQDFDPSKLQIPGIRTKAIYQVRVLDFISFPAALILSHLEFAFLYKNSYLDQFLQALQSLARNSQFQKHLYYWTNFMNSFKTEGMNFLDENAIDQSFLKELNKLLLACGVEMQADRLNIFNSSLALARKFYFSVEIINTQGRSIILNSISTEMNIPVFLHDQHCLILYPVQKYYKKGIRDISEIPERRYLTLTCGHDVYIEEIESSVILGENITCKVCWRNLYNQEKQMIKELIKIPQKRKRDEEITQNIPKNGFGSKQNDKSNIDSRDFPPNKEVNSYQNPPNNASNDSELNNQSGKGFKDKIDCNDITTNPKRQHPNNDSAKCCCSLL